MSLFEIIFERSLPVFGFRAISMISYCAFMMIAAYYVQKHKLSWFKSISFVMFFTIFVILLSDFTWSFAAHTRWRGYSPPTNEGTWLDVQPFPFGAIALHDITRWIYYVTGFALSSFVLRRYLLKGVYSLNKWVYITYAIYIGFWLGMNWLSPSPLHTDIGLWKIWTKFAEQTGQHVYYRTVFLADIVSRFGLNIPCCIAWFKK